MSASPRWLGRFTAGAGAGEEGTFGAGLSVAAGVLNATRFEHFTVPFIGNQSGNSDLGAIPVALDETNTRWRSQADLSLCTQARIVANVPAGGSAGTKMRVQYSADSGANWAYLDNVSGPEIDLVTGGHKASAWVNLTANAKADVWLRFVTIGGDAATHAFVANVFLEVRT